METKTEPVTQETTTAISTEKDYAEFITQLKELHERLRGMSPLQDGYASLNIEIPGTCMDYEQSPRFRVFFGELYTFEESSLPDLFNAILAYDPVRAKANRIADLEAILARLKGGEQ